MKSINTNLILLLLLLFWGQNVDAFSFDVDGVYYRTLSSPENAVEVVKYKVYGNYVGNIAIPSTVEYQGTTYDVVAIGEKAFQGDSELESVELPNSIVKINDNAFYMSGITAITIPYGVKSMGLRCFEDCQKLASIVLSNSVETIGSSAFSGCSNLSSIVIPNSVVSIGEGAFFGCKEMETVVLSSNLTSLNSFLFAYCEKLKSIEIPGSVQTIGESCFYECQNMEFAILPNSVVSIDYGAFAFCSNLEIVTLSSNLTAIPNRCFIGCSNLTTINLPSALQQIGTASFMECGLTSIILPKGLTNIEGEAFRDCQELEIVKSEIEEPFYLPRDAFSNSSGNPAKTAILYVPHGTKEKYLAKQYWDSSFKEIIENVNTYSLSITVSDNGAVLYDGTTIRNTTKAFTVEEGTSATITFTPDIGYKIKSVKVNSTDITSNVYNNQYTISNITADTSLEVEFEAIPPTTYTLSVKASGYGYALYNSTTIRNTTKTFTVEEGTSATISFTPDNGYIVKSLKVNNVDRTAYISNNQYTVSNIQSNTSVDVEFEAITHTLSIKASGSGVATYDGVNIRNATKAFTVIDGSSAVVKFTPDNGYQIKSVKVNSTNVTSSVYNNQYTISNITTDTLLEVEFEAIPPTTYTLSVKATGYGSASYNSTTIRNTTKAFTVNEGASATISFAPDIGYQIKSVKVNSINVTSSVYNNQYTISNITADTSLEVEFEPITYMLSITAIGNGSVLYNSMTVRNTTKTFTVNEGASATISFTPDSGYRVKSLKVNGVDYTSYITNNQYTISNIQWDKEVEVEFEAIPVTTYTLSIKATGYGYASYNGTSIRNTTKGFTVNEGSSITITITPDNGYRIKSVKKDGVTVTYSVNNNQYIFILLNNTTVEVEFEAIPPTYTLSIKATGNGSASYNGITIRNTTKNFTVNEGTTATITFSADDGYRIKSVKRDGATHSYANSQYTVSNIQSNTTIEVEFEEIPVVTTYTLSINATGNGSALYNSTTIRNATKTFTVNVGASITITFTPDNGYRIKSVKKDGVAVTYSVSNNQYTFLPLNDTTVEVEFEAIPTTTCTLSIMATGNGYASYNSTTTRNTTRNYTVNKGTSATIAFYPDNGYRIKSVKKDGTTVSITNNQYTVNNIQSNTSVEVEFELIPVTTYTLSIKATGNGSVSYNGTSIRNTTKGFTVNEGTSATITFTADNGYRIKSVKRDGATHSYANNQYTVSNIQSDTSIEVEFEAIPPTTYTLSIKATGNGSASYNGTSIRNTTKGFTVNEGTSATITFSADNGYRIKSVKKDGVAVTYSVSNNQYVFILLSNTTVEVEFEAIPVTTYTLSIKAMGNGSASYNNTNIRNTTSVFTVNEGTSATIIFSADEGYRIRSLKKDGNIATSAISNNQYTVSNIRSNTTVEVEFEARPTAISYQDVNYTITSFAERTVKMVKGNYGKVIEVPAKFTYEGTEWKVTGVEDGALSDDKKLAAVIWNPETVFTPQVNNPNLLLYVTSASYASASIKNVVVNGVASNIILTEVANGNDFYCPREFTAQRISYTHRFGMTTGMGEARGWESLALPFEVQYVTHETKGDMVPFSLWKSGDTRKPFWLKTLWGNGWTDASVIKANLPYIVSMPNHPDYKPEYLVSGKVTFWAENVVVKRTAEAVPLTVGNKQFVASFASDAKDAGNYALNVVNDYEEDTGGAVEGSRFILNLRQVHPFEAYIKTTSGARYVAIDDDNITNGIYELLSDREDRIIVYDLKGLLIMDTKEQTMKEVLRHLSSGVYIINGKKILVK